MRILGLWLSDKYWVKKWRWSAAASHISQFPSPPSRFGPDLCFPAEFFRETRLYSILWFITLLSVAVFPGYFGVVQVKPAMTVPWSAHFSPFRHVFGYSSTLRHLQVTNEVLKHIYTQRLIPQDAWFVTIGQILTDLWAWHYLKASEMKKINSRAQHP